MNSKDMVAKKMLFNKINEYFKKNPKSEAVIFRKKGGNGKVHYKVTKENNSYKIVEVASTKKQYIFEVDFPQSSTSSFKKPSPEDALKMKQASSQVQQQKSPTATQQTGKPIPGKDLYYRKDPTKEDPAARAKRISKVAQTLKPTATTEPEIDSTTAGQTIGKGQVASEIQRMHDLFASKKMDVNVPRDVSTAKQHLVNKGANQAEVDAFEKQIKALHGPETGTGKFQAFKKESKQIKEASNEFAQISKEFVRAMTPPFNHANLSNALKKANQIIGMVKEPNERNQIGGMIGALTNMVDSTTAQGGMTGQTRLTVAHKSTKGKKLHEKEDKNLNKKKEVPITKTSDSEEGKPQQAPGTGLETEPEQQQEPQGTLEPEKSTEQKALSRALKGQTIKSADIKLTDFGGEFTLNPVGTDMPIIVKWGEGKKVTVTINNKPYFFRR